MRMTKAARGHSLGGRLAAWLACAAIVAGLVSSAAPAEAAGESRGAAPVELVAPDDATPDAGDGGIQVLPPDDDGDDTPQPGEGTDGIRVQGDVPGDDGSGDGRPLGAQDEADGSAPQPTGDEGVAARAQDGAVIASGMWGQCEWEISSDGALTVRPGDDGGEGAYTNGNSPWAGYAGSITSVVFSAVGGSKVVAPANCDGLLRGLSKATYVDASGLDTSWVTNMPFMFYGCSKLESLSFPDGWATDNVTSMASMFSGCSKLESLSFPDGWATDNVTNMSSMFDGCSSLTTLDLSGWDTRQVTDMGSMFNGCSSLTSLDLSSWDTGEAKEMSFMFSVCSKLASLDLSGWDTRQVTDMNSMFSGCSKLASLDLSGWDTGQVTDMSSMFHGCSSLSTLDLSGWDTGEVTDMSFMFSFCFNLGKIYVGESWSTESVWSSDGMFDGCASLRGGAGTGYDEAHVDKEYARADRGKSGPGYLTGTVAAGWWGGCRWQVSDWGALTVHPGEGADTYGASPWAGHADDITSVVFAAEGDQKVIAPADCSCLLAGLENVESVDASGLDTSGVTNMSSMFSDCSKLRAVYVGGSWSTDSVSSSADMFYGCASLRGGAGTGYDEAHVDKEYARADRGKSGPGYLTGALALGTWGDCPWLVSLGGALTVRPGYDGFSGANTKGASPWAGHADDITSVVFAAEGDQKVIAPADCSCLLAGLENVESVDASGLDTSGVTNMSFMFYGCSSLSSLGLSGWDTGKVTEMSSMFSVCSKLASLDLSGWDTGKVTYMQYMFSGCSNLEKIYVGGSWSTDSVTSSANMFTGCASLAGGAGTKYDVNHVDKEYARADGYGGYGYLMTHELAFSDGAYQVGSAYDWGVFCDMVGVGRDFSGETVRLAEDIEVTRMAGRDHRDFNGTFDGDGHTLTVRYGTAESPVDQEFAAPFRKVNGGCTIKDLRVAGAIYTSAKYAAGIVGEQFKAVAVTGCRSSVAIRSSVAGDGSHGGLVGRTGNFVDASLAVEGCVFDGKVVSVGAKPTTSCGGLVGWKSDKGSLAIRDCLCAPAQPGDGEAYAGGATFCRQHSDHAADIENCYYVGEPLGDAQGKAARSVKAGDANTTVALAGAPAAYGASGISACQGNAGLLWGGALYAGVGDKVALSLGAVERLGYSHAGYQASAGTLSGNDADGYALTMHDEDVTVAAAYEPVDNAPLAQVLGHSLTLEGSVGVNTYLLVGDTISSNDAAYEVEFWRDGELARSKKVSDAVLVRQTVGGKTYLARRLTVTAVAKEMDVKFAMKIKAPNGTYVDFADTKGTPIDGAMGLDYSVNNYLNDMAQNGGTEELKRLCRDMRTYGAYARHYFGKRDDAEWGDPFPEIAGFELLSREALHDFEPMLPDAIDHFTYVGSTLVLEDETRFRLYFTSDDPTKLVASYRVGEGGDAAPLTIERGTGGFSQYHYVEVPNIVAKQLDDMYEFTFTNTDKNQRATVKHGPYAYVRWAVGTTGEDDNAVNLRYVASALYRYGEAAKAYFATRQQ